MEQFVSNDASKSQVENKLGRDLADLGSLPYNTSRMYKVPPILRNANREAYTPKEISIGPYHYSRRNLHNSYALKIKYLQSFLKRTTLELGTCVEMARGWEKEVREYYDGDGKQCIPDSDEFVQMILIDGIFILEFTWQCYNEPNQGSESLYMQASLKDDIMRDLMLLENQLPFFVLQGLADHAFPYSNHVWIFYLTKLFNIQLTPTEDSEGTCNILHLVDFIHVAMNSSVLSRAQAQKIYEGPMLELSRSATELQQAGVELECATDLILTDINFVPQDGALKIPRLLVDRNTETHFRNIIAYEHCHRKGHLFRSYVILMDQLINTSQDVKLLVDLKIIENSLGESEDVCTLFNNLYKMPMMNSRDFRFSELCRSLNEYRRGHWQRCKARWFRYKLMLRRDYFSSPWSIVSVIAAFILLVLTIIQTLCSIKGVKW